MLRQLLFSALLLPLLGFAQEKPNILVIVVDDQGYADLSAFEHSAPDVQTPNMDRLAGRGVLFAEAYATAPVCSPSRAGWNTGRHQVRWDAKSTFSCGLPKTVPTMAELLKKNGYVTGRIGKSDYSNSGIHRQDGREYPLNHGYDEFLGFCAHGFDYFLLTKDIENRTTKPRGHSASLGPLMHNRGTKEYAEGYLTEIFTDAAIDFVERHKNEPFYLTLAYNSVHHLIHQVPKRHLDKFGVPEIPNFDPEKDGPYDKWFKQFIVPGKKITVEQMRQYYLANLSCLDDNLGRFLDALNELGLDKNTLIFYFSDNGGPPTNGAWNQPLAGSKFTVWEGGIRIPFMLVRPNDPNSGQVWNRPVSTLDVLPTALDFAGIEIPQELDGSVIPKTQEGMGASRNLFWRMNDGYAVRSGDWKLMDKAKFSGRKPCNGIVYRPELSGKRCLFNLKNDPGETTNLLGSHPEVAQRLQELYDVWSKSVDGTVEAPWRKSKRKGT